jgi:D-ribose pyranose/furanose isomerase RbsD
MAKLGYTWYPKDWGNSESVFELNLSERGLYRELIDLAMLNDNKTDIKLEVWSRKFAISVDELKAILGRLMHFDLIVIKGNDLFIPSCESRLNLSRGGKKGSPTETSLNNLLKPTSKPISKPTSKQIEREIETKIEINKEIFNELFISESWIEINAKNNRTTPDKVKLYLTKFNNNLIAQGEKKNNKREYQSHFARWLPIELAKEVKDKPKFIPLI